MKTDATVEIIKWQNGELTLKLTGDIDIKQMEAYIQHRKDLYRKEMDYRYSVGKKYIAPPIELLLSDKYKKRTTGKNSQNTKLHGLIRAIANTTGNDFAMVKYAIKEKAMYEMNYPSMKDENGEVVWNVLFNRPFPQSEADCNTQEESLLIETAYRLAAEEGIYLE